MLIPPLMIFFQGTFFESCTGIMSNIRAGLLFSPLDNKTLTSQPQRRTNSVPPPYFPRRATEPPRSEYGASTEHARRKYSRVNEKFGESRL